MPNTASTPLGAWAGPRVSRVNPHVARILAATFPDYSGRRIELRLWTGPRRLENYWSGGTRSYWTMIDVAGRSGRPTNDNPFHDDAHAEFDLPAGWLAVEHCIFCGKDLGIRIYARAADAAALTSGPAQLTAGRP